MTDSLLLPFSGERLTDSTGAPLNGAYVQIYDAETLDQRDVFTDSGLTDDAAWPVTADGSGLLPDRYIGVGAYKAIARKADGTLLWERDERPGALDTSGFGGSGTAAPRTPVSVVASSRSITSTDFGKVLSVNPTSGDVILPFPSPAGITNGDSVTLVHNGTANAVILTFASQDPYLLTEPGEAVRVVSTAAAYLMVSDKSATAPSWYPKIADRLTAAPGSPTTGAYYLINGTPTGTWSTLGFQEHDLVRYDGDGSYILYRPTTDCMWLGTIVDEDLLVQFRGSAWVDLPNVTAPSSANLEYAIFADQRLDGVAGGTATASAWTKRTLVEVANTITGASLASSVVTLPTGKYLVWGSAYQERTTTAGIRILQGASTAHYGLPGNTATDSVNLTVFALINVTGSTDTIELQYYASANSSTNDLGRPLAISGNTETYAMLQILDLSSMQGPQGVQGTQGTDGLDAGYAYQWSTSTSGDPGSGKIAGNSGTIASITQLAISETDRAGNPMAAILATWDDSTSSVKSTITIKTESASASADMHEFKISGAGTDQGDYWTFPVTYVATSGTIANGNDVAVQPVRTGDKGDTGATGAAGATGATGATGPNTGLDYAWATATSGDPGSGKILANNATLASATAINISKTGRNFESLGSVIATWDDSTNTTHYGHLRVFTVADRTEFIEAEVTGLTDNSTYYAVTVTVTAAAGTPSANDVMAVMFERTGNTGAALAAGSSGQIQYNNAGNLGGGAGTTWDASSQRLRIDGASAAATYGTLTLSKTGGASSVLDLEHDYSGKVLRVLGPPDIAGRNPVTYIGNGGDINTRAWINVSGQTSGTGDGYAIALAHPTDPFMMGVDADVQTTLMLKTHNAADGRLLVGVDHSNHYLFAVNGDGTCFWWPASSTTFSAHDTQLQRAAAGSLQIGTASDASDGQLILGQLIIAPGGASGGAAQVRFKGLSGKAGVDVRTSNDGGAASIKAAGIEFGDTGFYGLQLNSLTSTQRDALTPAAGHSFWNTTIGSAQVSTGAAWRTLAMLETAQTWTLQQTFSTSIRFPNAIGIEATNAAGGGGGAFTAWAVDTGSNMTFGSASLAGNMVFVSGTGKELRFLNAAQSAYIIQMKESTKQVCFGSNSPDGLVTIYDSTATTGDSTLSLRAGAAREARLKFGSSGGTYDVGLARNAAGVLSVTDASTTLTNFRDLMARDLIASGTIKCGVYTVATLPAAGTAGAGARAFVTDATATHTAGVGATVTGGGANNVPVYSDGTNWRIG